MSPYRTIGENPVPGPEPGGPPDDDPILLGVALVVSLLGLVPRLITGGPWGAEPTLAVLIALVSAALLVRRRMR